MQDFVHQPYGAQNTELTQTLQPLSPALASTIKETLFGPKSNSIATHPAQSLQNPLINVPYINHTRILS